MKQNNFGQLVFSESDVCDLLMQGRVPAELKNVIIDPTVDIDRMVSVLEDPGALLTWTFPQTGDLTVPEFHATQQSNWHMPDEYKQLDIAEYVLSLCKNEAELQRCGTELMLYQERNLFDLLRYLKYLVDIMQANQVIWGVGRGSSVASYILYKLGVHRIDSMYYDLLPEEFLR